MRIREGMWDGRLRIAAVVLAAAGVWMAGANARAQVEPSQPQPPMVHPGRTGAGTIGEGSNDTGKDAGREGHISPSEARELLHSVDQILQFASTDTQYPVQKPVKRRLTTRDAVEKYILGKFNEDKDTRRLERSEIVLKKFGLLDRDFQLRPFLLRLLKEQIAGYYDDKTKTVNLLDWIPADQQKPVLAHELTHALQDQHTDLEKWSGLTSTGIAHTAAEDNQHLATDESDTSRDAVLEGQAMAVLMDYQLKPAGKTVLTDPSLVAQMQGAMNDTADSPVLARAPLLLQESLIFPYREGLGFVLGIWNGSGTGKAAAAAAFAGTMDRPPSSTSEILHPEAYLDHERVPMLRLPDVHALLDKDYEPYDVGVMGEFDVRILTQLFAGQEVAKVLAPAWRGGLYYAAQDRTSIGTPRQDLTASLGLFYLSSWATEQAAESFAKVYGSQIQRKYSRVKDDPAGAEKGETVWDTAEGPVVITVAGRNVFVSEGFERTLARKLEFTVVAAQQAGDTNVAGRPMPPGMRELSASLRQRMAGAGVMRVALQGSQPVARPRIQ